MRYHNIVHDDMRNGEGLRTTLFVAGCAHHCYNCHNPITWNPADGLEYDRDAEDELFSGLEKEHIKGLTLSGGDPLHPANIDDVTSICMRVKAYFNDTKTIWLYTGYDWEKIKNLPIMYFVDVVVDGQFIEELKSEPYHWAGSTNQRVIDVQKSRQRKEVVLYEETTHN